MKEPLLRAKKKKKENILEFDKEWQERAPRLYTEENSVVRDHNVYHYIDSWDV